MKIIETDNFGGDYPNESVVMSGLSQRQAEAIAERINDVCSGPRAPRYWRVVEDEYVLSPGFEP